MQMSPGKGKSVIQSVLDTIFSKLPLPQFMVNSWQKVQFGAICLHFYLNWLEISKFFTNFASIERKTKRICQRFATSTESSLRCICPTTIRRISMYATTSIVPPSTSKLERLQDRCLAEPYILSLNGLTFTRMN